MTEFSQRAAVIEERKTALISEYAAAHGRQPTDVEVLKLRQRATLETRPAKEHHSLGELTRGWRGRAERYIGDEPHSWVAGLAGRNDLPLLRAGDLTDEILADAAGVAVQSVAERRATFSRANVLAEVHRQFHGVRFASPDERIAVAERTADLLPWPSPSWSRHPSCTTLPSVCAAPTDRAGSGPRATRSTPPRRCSRPRPGCSRPGARWAGPPPPWALWRAVDRGQPARTAPSAQHRSGAGRGADRHLGPLPRRVGRPGRDGQVHHHGRAPSGVGSRVRSGLGAGPGPLCRRGRGAGRGARYRDGEHGQVALRAPPRSRTPCQDQRARQQAQITSRCLASPHALAPEHHRRRGRGGPVAPQRGPVGDRRRGQPGRHFRPRRARGGGRSRRGQGGPGR